MKGVPGLKSKVRGSRSGGFTLVELLVVIAVIGILAALLLSALSSIKDRAIRTKCLSNIKQFDLALLSYAQDNNDRLPTRYLILAGFNVAELQIPAVEVLIKNYGLTRSVLYDPGFPEHDLDGNWNYMTISNSITAARSLGYVNTCPTISLSPADQNATIVPQPVQAGSVLLPAPNVSLRVLLAGIIITPPNQNNPNQSMRTNYNYTPFPTSPIPELYLRPAHRNSTGRNPAGDNLGMLDGSAKWRKFDVMTPHTYYVVYPSTPEWTLWW